MSDDGKPDDAANEWFVAFTNPKREATLEKVIRNRRFDTYLPVMTVTRRRTTVKRPLFPRYVFVGLGGGQELYGLRQTPGLEGIVRVAGKPYRVAPEILTGLREAERAGTYNFTDDRMAERAAAARANAAKAFTPGTRVLVVDGPFRSFRGTVDELLPADRIAVFVQLFGTRHPVPMPIAHVELAAGVRS